MLIRYWRALRIFVGASEALAAKLVGVGILPAMRRYLALIVVLFALAPLLLFARDAREQARIDFLLRSVETSSGVKFIRNGSEYDGATAAKHLRSKLSYAGDRLKTAEEFVKYCASESSFTHQKYKIRDADGTTTDSATYFATKLKEFDAGKH